MFLELTEQGKGSQKAYLMIMLSNKVSVSREFVVSVGHKNHVAALFNRHVFIIAFDMSSSVREVSTQVMHAILIRVEATFSVLIEWSEGVSKQVRVRV